MGLPNVNSFTPLAILHLTGPYILHPDGCNPAMDLVVLLSPPQEHLGTEAPLVSTYISMWEVAERPQAKAGSPKLTTRVALWRMSGTKVWEVELEGDVDGLAWSLDGRCTETHLKHP